ncbi:MAG: hypothetical protein R3B96_01525 [Pirellulaceae bacterium]
MVRSTLHECRASTSPEPQPSRLEVGEWRGGSWPRNLDDPVLLADTFLAGMLYDVGQIVLADQFPTNT